MKRKVKIGLTYEELVKELVKNGWYFDSNDFSCRAPGGEPCASIEALQDICELYPTLTKPMLKILLAGHNIDITVKEDGYATTITIQPGAFLVSDNPPIFARPIKL